MPAEPHSDETQAAASASIPEVARIAADLIRFDTSNYGGGNAKGEREAAQYVGAYLESLGLEPEYFEPIPRRTNVMARVAGRNPDKPALILHGHLDVVPAAAESWTVGGGPSTSPPARRPTRLSSAT